MDPSAIDKLIPQMFDEMRYNLGNNNSYKKGNKEKHSSSAITTQSLLNELENLDKIIPMIESVDNSLQSALPSHLDRIHKICKSTNTLLDSWINIQSQAGHIHKLMSSKEYLEYSSAHINEDSSINSKELIEAEEREIEDLKRQINIEEEKTIPTNEIQSIIKPNTGTLVSTKGRVNRVTGRSGTGSSRVNKPSGIPSVNSRLTRPTVSSSRKMFR